MKLRQAVVAALAFASVGAIAAAKPLSADTSQPSSQSYTSSPGDSSQLTQIQQALNDKGLNAGPVDGKMGPKTKAAIKQFQAQQGLQASGKLDAQTVAMLTTGANASSNASSNPATSTNPASSQPGFSPQQPPSQQQQPQQSQPSSSGSPQG